MLKGSQRCRQWPQGIHYVGQGDPRKAGHMSAVGGPLRLWDLRAAEDQAAVLVCRLC